jgi:hypothetical protein
MPAKRGNSRQYQIEKAKREQFIRDRNYPYCSCVGPKHCRKPPPPTGFKQGESGFVLR